MFRQRHTTGKSLGIGASMIVIASTVAAITVSSASPTRLENSDAFPVPSMTSNDLAAAAKEANQGEASDATFVGVDPVVTGPVSAEFKQARAAAGCDRAEWPNVPKVCYPD